MMDIVKRLREGDLGYNKEAADEIERLKAITWAQAGEIDRLAAENYRLTNNVAALQNRLYLNKIPHELIEDANGK
jgi:hypothetical protein